MCTGHTRRTLKLLEGRFSPGQSCSSRRCITEYEPLAYFFGVIISVDPFEHLAVVCVRCTLIAPALCRRHAGSVSQQRSSLFKSTSIEYSGSHQDFRLLPYTVGLSSKLFCTISSEPPQTLSPCHTPIVSLSSTKKIRSNRSVLISGCPAGLGPTAPVRQEIAL
jgi:hypothetical protein